MERESYFNHGNRVFCSEECRIAWMRKTGGYVKGIPKSDETRKKISRSKRKEIDALSEEQYHERFATRTGQSPSKETRKKISDGLANSKQSRSKRNKEIWDSFSEEEKKKRIRKANSSRAKHRFYYISSIAGKVFLHSSYEKRIAQVFDKLNFNWVRNEDAFPYEYKGRTHYYTPDFLVLGNGEKVYYETKGYFFHKDHAKISGFRKLGYTLVVIDEGLLKMYEESCQNLKK